MGRATRWFRGILGMKKEKEKDQQSGEDSNSVNGGGDKKDKKRWSFGKSGRGYSSQIPPVIIPANNANDSAWLRSYISETEQNKHAIAVAAATAAAADAAVAAAQAAVAVVRLTSHGRGTLFNGGRERWAAMKIQTVFKGYLARKALRALKGLVKLQALVRGYLVRKRAAATLHSMQALFRAQTSVRSQRARRSLTQDHHRFPPEIRARRSIERFDETRSEFHSKRLSTSHETSFNGFDDSPKIVEIDTFKPRSRSRRLNTMAGIAGMSDSSDDLPYPTTLSSPLPYPPPALLSIPEPRNFKEFEWIFTGDECRFSTAQSTPRFTSSTHTNAVAPLTPAKSVCGDSFFRPYSNFPSYMASTQSFKAKLRSHSAPKQRPEPGPKKNRLSLNEIMASRTSFSGVKMQRSCSQVQDALNF